MKMTFVEWFDENENKMKLSEIPTKVFIEGLFWGETSLRRWHKNGKQFAYLVPKRYVSYRIKER